MSLHTFVKLTALTSIYLTGVLGQNSYTDYVKQYIPDSVSQYIPYSNPVSNTLSGNPNTTMNVNTHYPIESPVQYSRITDPLSTTVVYNTGTTYHCDISSNNTASEQFIGQYAIDRSITHIKQLEYYNALHCLYYAKNLLAVQGQNNQRSTSIINRLIIYIQYNGQSFDLQFNGDNGVIHTTHAFNTNNYNQLTMYERIDPGLLAQQSSQYQQQISEYHSITKPFIKSKQLTDILISSERYEQPSNTYSYSDSVYKDSVVLDGRYTRILLNNTYNNILLNQRNNVVFVKYGVVLFAGYTTLLDTPTIQRIIDASVNHDTVRQLFERPVEPVQQQQTIDPIPISQYTKPSDPVIISPVVKPIVNNLPMYQSSTTDFGAENILDTKQINNILYLAEQVCTYQQYNDHTVICNLYANSQLWHWLTTRLMLDGVHSNNQHAQLDYMIDNNVIQLVRQQTDNSGTTTQSYSNTTNDNSKLQCFVGLVGTNTIEINEHQLQLQNGQLQCITSEKQYTYSNTGTQRSLLHWSVSNKQVITNTVKAEL